MGKAFESIVASLRYINLADEPSLYCDSKKLNRYVSVIGLRRIRDENIVLFADRRDCL